MSLDSNVNEFSFEFAIENFSRECYLPLFSRTYCFENLGDPEWYLKYEYLPAHENRNFISIYLKRISEDECVMCTIDFTITVVATDLSLNVSKRISSVYFADGDYQGFQRFMRMSTILAKPNIYLPHDTLTIKCFMVLKSDIEDLTVASAEEVPMQINSCPNALSKDLSRLYLDEKFCDLHICTADRIFRVHKTVLCARSPVFSAMFANDTKENRSGAVDITDMDSDTVSRMLKFVYSDELEEMDRIQVVNLYAAADKYEILPLKERCSTMLKSCLSEVNVCDIYALADMHQDLNLKAAAQNYVFVYAHKVLKSSEWLKFMQLDPRMSAEIMHKICIKYIND